MALVGSYTRGMPKLWDSTIESHRRAVRDAVLDAAAALVAEHGLRSVTMSQIAQAAGVGRATLYKYFPDVESILTAWHGRQITGHLEYLAEIRDRGGDAAGRLEAVLEAYALISRESGGHDSTEPAPLLHRDEQVGRAQQQVRDMIADLLREATDAGAVRDDVAPEELAAYCLHALTAASSLPSAAAVRRLVTVTMDGLRPRADRSPVLPVTWREEGCSSVVTAVIDGRRRLAAARLAASTAVDGGADDECRQ